MGKYKNENTVKKLKRVVHVASCGKPDQFSVKTSSTLILQANNKNQYYNNL